MTILKEYDQSFMWGEKVKKSDVINAIPRLTKYVLKEVESKGSLIKISWMNRRYLIKNMKKNSTRNFNISWNPLLSFRIEDILIDEEPCFKYIPSTKLYFEKTEGNELYDCNKDLDFDVDDYIFKLNRDHIKLIKRNINEFIEQCLYVDQFYSYDIVNVRFNPEVLASTTVKQNYKLVCDHCGWEGDEVRC